MREPFHKFSSRVSRLSGTASMFILALSIVALWALSGPIFNFSNTWQLAINTTTTIVTFLMVFIIQNTQTRDSKAMQLKLDELLRVGRASDSYIDLEDMTEQELDEVDEHFKELHKTHPLPDSMHKLHKRIQAQKARNKSKTIGGEATHLAGQVIDLLNPFDHPSGKK